VYRTRPRKLGWITSIVSHRLYDLHTGENDRSQRETLVTHYAEGSLEPLLVNKYIFKRSEENAPLLIRPLVKLIFGKLDSLLVSPNLEKHGKLVCVRPPPIPKVITSDPNVLQIEMHLTKVGRTGWFAGLDHPTSADFMMCYTLDEFVLQASEFAGSKAKEWVKKMQGRPAFKKVSALLPSHNLT